MREALFIAQGGRFPPKLNMETLGTTFRMIRMIFPPKLGPFGANMGPGDPVVQPAPGCHLSHRLSSETLLGGPPSCVCRCRGLYINFLCQMGPSCKCNIGCDHLWFLLHILCVFILFRTCTPEINKSPTLVEIISNNPYHYY